MTATYKTAGKTQVFLKAGLAGMNAQRIDDTLVIEAPEGKLFANGEKHVRYVGKYGTWKFVYGAALTAISKPLADEVVPTKRKFFWSKR
ncbi:hypothetical protein UFOVP46_90 [uncultured Caudovirales phage]|uniref:Uncharacterized protein n=1 Tax=uncultured Caudovirales phage TaxID=2100421 RepID=A0A6J5KS77_9CAUD|nr:hypothetical protein UFOVP46_90 [uncultured Caudovirales phage]